MRVEELHLEVDTFTFTWTHRALLHAMIDLGRVTALECQWPECRYPGQPFTKNNTKGAPLRPSFDHIDPRHKGGLDRIENLRIVHGGCNSSWRRGLIGSFHTPESRRLVADRARQQHADGRGPDYTDPVRSARISAALSGRMTEPAQRGWETRRAHQRGGE